MAQKQTIRIYQKRIKRNGRAKKKRNKHDDSKPYKQQGR